MIGPLSLIASRRSRRLSGIVAYVRASMVALSLICTVTACHQGKRPTVRVEVFEDHVSVDGVRTESPIQQIVDEQTKNNKSFVMLIPRQPLSAERLDQLKHASENLHPGIEIRRVQLECLPNTASTCR
jgi:hypothetical protein